jgi:sulfur carrier protein ThiS
MRRMTTTDNNIKMDLESSMGKDKDVPHEETVEELIRKLNMKGTKVKVLKDGDAVETPQRQSTK